MLIKYERGFSLMSVLITVVIIGILAAISLPAYQRYVQKTRRAQAAACVMEYSQFLERFRSTNLRYDQDSSGAAIGNPPTLSCATSDNLDQFYTMRWNPAATSYTVTADAISGTMQDNDGCGDLSYTNTGLKSAQKGEVADCW